MTTDLDFSTYQPPGTSFDETVTATVPSVTVPPTVIALVGVAVGYQQNTDQVTLDTTAVVLSQIGVIVNSIVVTNATTGATIPSSDYTIANPTGNPLTDQNYTTNIVLSGSAVTTPGTVAFVSYNYQTPDYFTPKPFTSFEDIKDVYGEPLNLAPQTPGDTTYQPILSPLSLAAQVAMNQGTASLVMVAVAPPTGSTVSAKSTSLRSHINSGYSLISGNFDVNVVIPVTYGILDADAGQAAIDLKNHVDSCTADGFRRIGMIGFDPAPSGSVNTAAYTRAASIADSRIMLFTGTGLGVSYYNGQTNQYLTLGEGFLAVAGGGEMATQAAQEPLTKKYLAGFAGLVGQPLTKAARNKLSAAGVCVVEADRNSRLQIRHGTSTLRTNVNTREISLVRSKDAMLEVLDAGIEASGLIGSPTTLTTETDVQAVVTSMLELCVDSGVIIAYKDITVTQTSTDPSVLTVSFSYRPTYPLNYIVFSFTVDVTTGDNTLADLAVAA